MLRNAWRVVKTIKGPLSYIVGLTAAGAAAKGNLPLAGALTALAAWLNGAGHAASDREEKARQVTGR